MGKVLKGHDILLSANGMPRVNHGVYVRGVFLRLLLDAEILTKSGRAEAEKKLASIPAELREVGRVKCDR